MPEDKTAAPADVIVALAASAADTRALERFLAHLTPQDGMATVVILQHREALNEERFRQALADAGRELTPVQQDAIIEAGRIYWPAPGQIVTVENGCFQIRPAEQRPGERGTVDSFLVSLAREEDGRPVAVLFTLVGGDGTLGVAAIKEAGGLAVVEQSEEDQAGDLAASNSPAALADVILPAEALAERVALHVRQFAGQKAKTPSYADAPEIAAVLTSIATILRKKTGHDFHGYKRGTFLRRVQRRMQVVQAESLDRYVEVLRGQAEEAQLLFNDLLIGVTQFFRDAREFEVLERGVIPKLFEGKVRGDQLRVWVIGCSTGEEAYSIAILLREHMAALEEVPQVQIFATDLDGRALASARAGRYTDTTAKDMSPERLARWFVKEGNTYCVVKELREMCIFSQHSVIKDPPFSRLDLVSCRNLLIYLDADLQSRVIPLFHFALKPSGYLFLGGSENVSRHTTLFAPVENRSRIFRRLETSTRILPDFPFTAVDPRVGETTTPARPTRPAEAALAFRAERIVERYAPAYVVTDEAFNVLHFSGRTGRFLEPSGGAASLNLLNLIHPDLRLDLRTALTRAGDQNAAVQVQNIGMGLDGQRALVDLVVEPFQDDLGSGRSFVVLLKDGVTVPAHANSGGAGAPLLQDERVQQLETELRASKERLQAVLEEYESTNEELKASNEEYQSLNEELQSANEELETSKEELQSMNEELTTVNGELAHRVQELDHLNSDLKNLLESTQIATIFLDNELRVTNYTPAVAEVFHLIESDIGRPISHVKARISYEELHDDVQRVLRTLGSVDREVQNPAAGIRYMARVLPYRSVNNVIRGAVLTFMDITPLTQAEAALRQSEERFRLIVESARDYAIFTMDAEGRIETWPAGAEAVFGWAAEEAVGRPSDITFLREDREKGIPQRELIEAREKGYAPNVRWHQRKDGSRVFIEGSTRPLQGGGSSPQGFLKIGQDVTERKRADEALKASESRTKLLLAELQHRVRNTLSVVRSIARRTAETSESVEDYAMHLDGRIDAFGRVQAAVTRNPTAGIDLAMLVADELLAVAAHEEKQVQHIKGPQVRLQPKAAEILALALHELATNAVKYGALSVERGRISVEWKFETVGDYPRLMFHWIETGVKLSGTRPARSGFGTELIERTLAYDLESIARLNFTPDGLHCTINLPADGEILLQDGQPVRES